MGKFTNKWKELSDFIKTSTIIIGCFLALGSGMLNYYKKFDEFVEKVDKVVEKSSQIEENRKAIEEIKLNYTPLILYDEHTKFIITQIDLEIDETMSRVAKREYIGTRYVQALKYYYDNFTFLSSKQKSSIEVIMRYYDKQELRNNITNQFMTS